MIYLIGGPPRCGKTSLAKKLAKRLRVSWVSADTLDAVSRVCTPKEQWEEKYPYRTLRRSEGNRSNDAFYATYSPRKIISVIKKQGKQVEKGIDAFIACQLADGQDYIIEGYHISPQFVARMQKQYNKANIRAVFLGKENVEQFAKDVHKSSTPNDWLLRLTKEEETFIRVGKMVQQYSCWFKKEAEKCGFCYVNMDKDFVGQLKKGMTFLKEYV